MPIAFIKRIAIARVLGIGFVMLLASVAPPRTTRAQDDDVKIASEERKAGGDANKRYFLIGPKTEAGTEAPADGYRLLIVMPGGDGSAEFLPFVKRIAMNCVSDQYIVAQPVAKAWNPKQAEEVVWPIAKNRIAGVKFSTEEFVEAVIADVEKTYKIDPRYVFTLGWSSSGPPSYAVSLRPKRRVTGSFVAMSVFFGGMYGNLSAAKGHAYYILHSPDDFIPIARAENARDLLTKNGANVKFATYEGGHGWHGDVFGEIRQGIEWLEKNHAESKGAE